jgi:hypothetical protein
MKYQIPNIEHRVSTMHHWTIKSTFKSIVHITLSLVFSFDLTGLGFGESFSFGDFDFAFSFGDFDFSFGDFDFFIGDFDFSFGFGFACARNVVPVSNISAHRMSEMKNQISNIKYQISNIKYQISNFKF